MSDQFIPLDELGERTTAVDSDLMHIRSTGKIDSKISVTNFLKSALAAIFSTITGTVITADTKILTDTIDEKTASAGITFNNQIKVDAINEKTTNNGITIDGVSLKDGIVNPQYGVNRSASFSFPTNTTSNAIFDALSPYVAGGAERLCYGALFGVTDNIELIISKVVRAGIVISFYGYDMVTRTSGILNVVDGEGAYFFKGYFSI